MASLIPSELLKYSYRKLKFLKKYKDSELFETVSSKKVSLLFDEAIYNIIRSEDKDKMRMIVFTDIDGNQYRLSDLKKTGEFGGRDPNFSVRDENAALDLLNSQINTIKTSKNMDYIHIKIGDGIFPVKSFHSTQGTPKSDWHGIGDDGKACCWISHKKGKKPSDYQQWGGVSELRHPEITKFIDDIMTKYPKGVGSSNSLYRPIQDLDLIFKSMYGNDYGGEFGENNVNVIIQGDPVLIDKGDYYKLSGMHVLPNGVLPSDEYMPVFIASYRKARNDRGIPDTRLGIWPKNGRKATLF